MLLPFALAGGALYAAYRWFRDGKKSPAPRAMVGADVDGPAFTSYPPGCTGKPTVTTKTHGNRAFRCSVYKCAGQPYAYYAVCQESGTTNWIGFVGYRNGNRVFFRGDAPNRQILNALCVALGVKQ